MASSIPRSSLVETFRRKGHSGASTVLFDELAASEQHDLSALASLGERESAVLLLRGRQRPMVLVTTERIIWLGAGVAVSTKDIASAQILPNPPEIGPNVRTLLLRTVSRKEFKLECDPGAPLIGTYYVLRRFALKNSQRTR